jgi:hypothetical protein
MARSRTATAEAIFWPAIEAFALRARTTSLDPRSKGRLVALARIKRSVEQFLVTMPRDGAIVFSDLIIKLDVLYVYCRAFVRILEPGIGRMKKIRAKLR